MQASTSISNLDTSNGGQFDQRKQSVGNQSQNQSRVLVMNPNTLKSASALAHLNNDVITANSDENNMFNPNNSYKISTLQSGLLIKLQKMNRGEHATSIQLNNTYNDRNTASSKSFQAIRPLNNTFMQTQSDKILTPDEQLQLRDRITTAFCKQS